MCGITGIYDCQSYQPIDKSLLTKMNQSLHHRGPDDEGIYCAKGIGLGHTRLSIIDIKSGHQPMFNAQGTLAIVFNGEIYNFKTLRDELTQLGAVFKTHSDTEVLVYGYEYWGVKLLNRLRGMFAFALWDENKKELFLARDRFGIKPLFYSHLSTGEFAFASELKALTQHPSFSKKLCAQGVSDYFAYGYIPEPKTIYEQCFKLNPGHYLKVKLGEQEFKQERYWDVPQDSIMTDCENDLAEALRHQVLESVEARLISEVPLGAFLSGGVDSSVVVSAMAQLMDSKVTTCAIGFDEKAFDESEYSQQVAKLFKTDHYHHQVKSSQLSDIGKLNQIYDEPFADSSCIPTLKVCQVAKEHVSVALSGDGGDEVFAGYRRYRGHLLEERFRNMMPLSLRKGLFKPLAAIYPRMTKGPRWLRGKATLESLCYDAIEGYFQNICLFKPHFHQKLFSKSFHKTLNGYAPISVLKNHAKNASMACPLQLIQYLDMKTYLPGDILTKVDRASMHYSLEVRVPLLDHHLVSFAQGLPANLKIKNQVGKYIMKKAYEDKLPSSILYRKKKGFAVPLGEWFRGPLRSRALRLLSSASLIESELFDMNTIKSIVNMHMSFQADHSAMIWSLCMFEDFMNAQFYIDKESEGYANIACA